MIVHVSVCESEKRGEREKEGERRQERKTERVHPCTCQR